MGSATKTLSNIMNNNNSSKPKVHTPLSNDLLQQFDAFNLNSSPAPSHHSNTSSHHSGSKPNHQKSQTALDAFADFDDFAATAGTGTRTGTETGFGASTKSITTSNTKLNDSFFDAFNDNFGANQNLTAASMGTTKPNDQKAAFNDNFEDNFKVGNASGQLDNHNFAKFDAFEAHNFSNDFGNSSFGEKQNGHNGKAKKEPPSKDKFEADYSKPESFDADLEEALKRSMVDN